MRIEHGIGGPDTDIKITATIRGKGQIPQEFQQAFKACGAVRITYLITEVLTSLAGSGSYEIIMEATGAPEVVDH